MGNTDATAGPAIAVRQTVRQWCRWCDEPATVARDAAISPSFGKAVHAATGLESGPDDNLAAPIDMQLAARPGERP
jgi:hypothetical protein